MQCNLMVHSLSVLEGGMSNSNVRPFHDCAPIIPTAKDWAPVFFNVGYREFFRVVDSPVH